MSFAGVVDSLIEAPIAPSFTRIGYQLRSRLERWRQLSSYDLTGRTIVVTGATSGIGRQAAEEFARLGSHVVISGRDPVKVRRVRAEIAVRTGSSDLSMAVADMAELDQVQAMAEQLLATHARIDVLVHNAGALSGHRSVNSAGVESTVASQVLGPFLLTSRLMATLSAGGPGRVLTMSSGGMYAAGLSVDNLQMTDTDYRGSERVREGKASAGDAQRDVGEAGRPNCGGVSRHAPRMGRHSWRRGLAPAVPAADEAVTANTSGGRRHTGLAGC